MSQIIYYGETSCQGMVVSHSVNKPCKNNAYYFYNNLYLCGVHCKSADRFELPRRDKKEIEEQQKQDLQEELKIINMVKEKNILSKSKGRILIAKLGMMKKPIHIYGYLNVYPNEKDGGRKDGFGCPSLSPKVITNINHGQPNLPISKNLENFHQGQ
jgi:hypothetical protein